MQSFWQRCHVNLCHPSLQPLPSLRLHVRPSGGVILSRAAAAPPSLSQLPLVSTRCVTIQQSGARKADTTQVYGVWAGGGVLPPTWQVAGVLAGAAALAILITASFQTRHSGAALGSEGSKQPAVTSVQVVTLMEGNAAWYVFVTRRAATPTSECLASVWKHCKGWS